MACAGFLVGGTGASVLVGGSGSCPLGGRATSSGIFWCVFELSKILGGLSANGWGCVPVLLFDWHGASSVIDCWPLGGAGS